jgi:Asp/Glu/hydantoin racemase
MKRIAVMYTSFGPLVNYFHGILSETLKGWEIIRIADESLIRDVMRTGAPDDNIRSRAFAHIQSAVEAGAQTVVIACSSVGEVAEEARERFPVPIVRIDDAMAARAVQTGSRIGVIASLETTIGPTVRLVQKAAAAAGKDAVIVSRVAKGAYEALGAGQSELHDELIAGCAREIEAEVDVILLAQGSMARLEEPLGRQVAVPVLASPGACAQALKAELEG